MNFSENPKFFSSAPSAPTFFLYPFIFWSDPNEEAEDAKHREVEDFCHSHGWLFTAMGWNCWGGLGPRGAALQRRLDKTVAGDLQGWPRKTTIRLFRQRVILRLMAFVGTQLLAIEDALPMATSTGDEWRDPARLGERRPFLPQDEIDAWESEEQEDPMPPLRITTRRA